MHDIDGDGTEELLLGEGYASISLGNMYTINNNQAVLLEAVQWMGHLSVNDVSLFMNGTLRTYDEQWGAHSESFAANSTYYRLKDGALVFQTTLTNDNDAVYTRYDDPGSFLNGVSITQEEYFSLKQELEGDGQVVALDWKPLREYQIEKEQN